MTIHKAIPKVVTILIALQKELFLPSTDSPFILLSAVNLPGRDGTELRQLLNENEYLRKKSIPFIFLTAHTDPENVEKSYDLMVQGYFEKDNNYEIFKNTIKVIIHYWTACKHPNNT